MSRYIEQYGPLRSTHLHGCHRTRSDGFEDLRSRSNDVLDTLFIGLCDGGTIPRNEDSLIGLIRRASRYRTYALQLIIPTPLTIVHRLTEGSFNLFCGTSLPEYDSGIMNDERFAMDPRRYDEILFWKSLAHMNLNDFNRAGLATVGMLSFDDPTIHADPLNARMAAPWHSYRTWRNTPSFENFEAFVTSFDEGGMQGLSKVASMQNSPIAIEDVERMFAEIIIEFGIYTKEARKANDSELLEGLIFHFSRIIDLASTFSKSTARPDMFGCYSDAVENSLTAISGILADLPMEVSIPSEDENAWYSAASDIIMQAQSFFPHSPLFTVERSKVLRRSSERPEIRKLSCELMDKTVAELEAGEAEIPKAVLIEIGMAWREYLEALIHFERDNERAISSAYGKAKNHLERTVITFPDDPEAWLNLSWLLYTWGKKLNDLNSSISFAKALYAKFNDTEMPELYSMELSMDIPELLRNAELTEPTATQMTEVRCVYGWSLAKQALKDIDYSKTARVEADFLLPASGLADEAVALATGRRSLRDAFYLKSYTDYLLCKTRNDNLFSAKAPNPDSLNSTIVLPEHKPEALERCGEVHEFMISKMFQVGLEHDQSEIYYALGLIQAERFEFGSLRRFYFNHLFHSDIEENSYYAELLDFVKTLYTVRVQGIQAKDEEALQQRLIRAEGQQVRGFGAIENLFMAIKKKKGENKKLQHTRSVLIKALSYQICFDEAELADRISNLLLITKLQLDNVRDAGDKAAAQVSKLEKYIETVFEWDVHKTMPEATRRLFDQVRSLDIPRLVALIDRKKS